MRFGLSKQRIAVCLLLWESGLANAKLAPPTSAIGSPVKNSNSFIDAALGVILETPQTLQLVLTDAFNAAIGTLGNLGQPELHYSYGHLPAVYPSPQGSGDAGWSKAYEQARGLVSQMTNKEKNDLTYGVSSANGCSGFSGSVSRVGFPGLCLQDAESGVRTGDLVNGYPAQISIGSSWNRTLAYERGKFLGREFKVKGASVALGPVVGPIGRVAKGGRNWEGFSNDPYVVRELISPTITAMQQSVIACVKHFVAYEQETNRQPFLNGFVEPLIEANQSVSSNLDDKTMHELYLWPFYDAVKAGAGSVMASYNKINGSYVSANSKTINGLMKTELGFQGFLLSDWYGQHTGIASANAGLDMAMPSSKYWDNGKLAVAVANGSVNSTRLDDMAVRILASWYRYAELDKPGLDANKDTDARDPAAESTIFQGAVEGHVLVKNVNNALPLSKPKHLSIFGYDAVGGLDTSTADVFKYPISLANTETYPDGRAFTDLDLALFGLSAEPPGKAGPGVALEGTLLSGGGSGGITPVSSISPYDAFIEQAKADKTTLQTDFKSSDPDVDASTDACIVLINEQSAETWDRPSLADEYSDELVMNVASKCANTIVVIHNAGIRLVDRWIENPNITAVIFGHLPGQASGSALTEVMYGRQSPSGRLPYTVANEESDYGSLLNPDYPTAKDPYYSQSDFIEGLFIDYKHFAKNNITPRFAFGFGLTYTSFNYSKLSITRDLGADVSKLPPGRTAPNVVAPEGGVESLYDELVTVRAVIVNTGKMRAAEVAQLYLGIPGSDVPLVLRGFDKVMIESGESSQVTFSLRRRDLSIWDTVQQEWVLPSGTFKVSVGKSVLDTQHSTLGHVLSLAVHHDIQFCALDPWVTFNVALMSKDSCVTLTEDTKVPPRQVLNPARRSGALPGWINYQRTKVWGW